MLPPFYMRELITWLTFAVLVSTTVFMFVFPGASSLDACLQTVAETYPNSEITRISSYQFLVEVDGVMLRIKTNSIFSPKITSTEVASEQDLVDGGLLIITAEKNSSQVEDIKDIEARQDRYLEIFYQCVSAGEQSIERIGDVENFGGRFEWCRHFTTQVIAL